MADIFISYKSERRDAAEHLCEILRLNGYSAWFDYGLLSGRDFSRQIERELRDARAVIVLWCSRSVESDWVNVEAHLAKRLNKYVPVWIEPVELPLEFLRDHTLDLTHWDGGPRSTDLDGLFDEMSRLVGRAPRPEVRNLRELEARWSRFGSPTLAQFALSKSIESELDLKTRRTSELIEDGKTTTHANVMKAMLWPALGVVFTIGLGAVRPLWEPVRAAIGSIFNSGEIRPTQPDGPEPDKAMWAQFAQRTPSASEPTAGTPKSDSRTSENLAIADARAISYSEAAAPPEKESVTPAPQPKIVISPHPSSFDILDRARYAIDHEDKKGAVALLTPLAATGNAIAEYQLAWLFTEGAAGVERNPGHAATLFRSSAAHGSNCGTNRVGELYAEGGFGVPDSKEAVRWWQKSAAQGNPWAKYNLGLSYKDGTGGLPNNATLAVHWLDEAAAAGIVNAMSYLAAIYLRSDQLPHDPKRAAQHLARGAMLGHENMQYRLAKAYLDGSGVSPNKDEAYVWASLSAAQGQPEPARFAGNIRKSLPAQRLTQLDAEVARRSEEIYRAGYAADTALRDLCWRP